MMSSVTFVKFNNPPVRIKSGIAKSVKLESDSIIIELACVKLTIGSKIKGITDAIMILNATGTPINKQIKNMNKTQKSIIIHILIFVFRKKFLDIFQMKN